MRIRRACQVHVRGACSSLVAGGRSRKRAVSTALDAFAEEEGEAEVAGPAEAFQAAADTNNPSPPPRRRRRSDEGNVFKP